MSRFAWLLIFLFCACRIERVSPQAAAASTGDGGGLSGELWIYTSMYRHVVDALEPLVKERLPGVTVHWYQAGSEKVLTRLEGELSAGGTQADVLLTSDPFLYARFKEEHRWRRYVSPNGVRTALSLQDPDGHFSAVRLSTMVLVHRADVEPPVSFRELTEEKWKGEVALGDPLTSGTAFTWSVFLEHKYGGEFFKELRANGARVVGGNAAVLQKLEGREAKVGVVLLENVLTAKAKGSSLKVTWPADGAVVIPGYAGILAGTRNPLAAQALVDVLLSPEGQKIIVELGDMHAADPRLPGPRGWTGTADLLERSQPWDDALLLHGHADGAKIKQAFSEAFSK